eukprot:364830-Chlamydomonas_euryale.AAC.11
MQEESDSMDMASSSRESNISVEAAAVACAPTLAILLQVSYGVLLDHSSLQSVANLDLLLILCAQSTET